MTVSQAWAMWEPGSFGRRDRDGGDGLVFVDTPEVTRTDVDDYLHGNQNACGVPIVSGFGRALNGEGAELMVKTPAASGESTIS